MSYHGVSTFDGVVRIVADDDVFADESGTAGRKPYHGPIAQFARQQPQGHAAANGEGDGEEEVLQLFVPPPDSSSSSISVSSPTGLDREWVEAGSSTIVGTKRDRPLQSTMVGPPPPPRGPGSNTPTPRTRISLSLRPTTRTQMIRGVWKTCYADALRRFMLQDRSVKDQCEKRKTMMGELRTAFQRERTNSRLKLLQAETEAAKTEFLVDNEEPGVTLDEGAEEDGVNVVDDAQIAVANGRGSKRAVAPSTAYREALLASGEEGVDGILQLLDTVELEIGRLGKKMSKVIGVQGRSANGPQAPHPAMYSKLQEVPRALSDTFQGKLLPFQLEGVQWLYHHLYLKNLNGILADEMGLGKTVQVIALLCVLKASCLVQGPHLISTPLSTLSNWVTEFERFAPGMFRVFALYEVQQDEDLREFFNPRKKAQGAAGGRKFGGAETDAAPNHPYGFDVVIVPHSTFAIHRLRRMQSALLSKVQWHFLVVDEAQRIKSKESVLFRRLASAKVEHRLALTGTPLQNDIEEVWSLFSFLMPDHFTEKDTAKLLPVFTVIKEKQREQRAKAEAQRKKRQQQRNGGVAITDDQAAVAEAAPSLIDEREVVMCLKLHSLLEPLCLRRCKSDVLDQLPKKTEHVIYCPLAPLQKEWLADRSRCKNNHIARKVLLHPYLMLYEFRICEDVVRDSGKAKVLDILLQFLIRHNHKTLVFCTWTKPLDVVETIMQLRGWRFARLDGSTKSEDRQKLIESFSTDPEIKAFFLSKGAGGVGLNLQAADSVILLDVDYNPQKDLQALSRVYRVGQTRDVCIYHLVTDSAVEWRMRDIAGAKSMMERKVIQAGRYDLHSTEEVREQLLRDVNSATDPLDGDRRDHPGVLAGSPQSLTSAGEPQLVPMTVEGRWQPETGAGENDPSEWELWSALRKALPRNSIEARAVEGFLESIQAQYQRSKADISFTPDPGNGASAPFPSAVQLAHIQPDDSSADSGDDNDDDESRKEEGKVVEGELNVEDEDSVELQFLAEEEKQYEPAPERVGARAIGQGTVADDDDIFNDVV